MSPAGGGVSNLVKGRFGGCRHRLLAAMLVLLALLLVAAIGSAMSGAVHILKKLSAALVGATFVLAGCNTMSGMGQDIKAGGEKLEKAADR